MWILYDVLFILFSLVYFPIFLLKLRQADNKKQLLCNRCGIFSRHVIAEIENKKVVWLHAVSVGEVFAARTFVELLRNKYPTHAIVISTVTPTGNSVARKLFGDSVTLIYLPFDIRFITWRVVTVFRPALLILMETEIWPNLIESAHRFGTRIVVANGRISPKSFRNYYRVQFLLRSVFRQIDLFLVQTTAYAKRLRKIGVNESRIVVTGNMKFDNVDVSEQTSEACRALKVKKGFAPNDLVLIAASTHKGEEAIVCSAFAELRKQHAGLKLLIAPRHIERASDIARLVAGHSFHFNCASEIFLDAELSTFTCKQGFDVLILNTIGELHTVLQFAHIVIMGGSFIKHGGQNPLEAAVFKKPIITGPFYFNFKDVYNQLRERNAVCIVQSSEELGPCMQRLMTDTNKAEQLGMAASAFISEMKGASQENVRCISRMLEAEQ